jgi:ELWxxDGT repeat protein
MGKRVYAVMFFIQYAILSQVVAASGATLVFDLNPGSTGSFPSNLTSTANFLLLNAYTLDTGRELFRTDGTNITLVFDINETKDDIGFGVLEGNDSLPAWLTPFNGEIYFSAYDPRRGAELWRTDGTNVQRVSDINPDSNDTIKFAPNSSWPSELTVFHGALYFSADNSAFRTNYELWKYDGANATMVTNIHADLGAAYSSYPNNLKVWNDALYFMADDGEHGFELYKHDGSITVLLSDINAGTNSSHPKQFTSFKNELVFVAERADVGYELFKTDGTNVTLAADIVAGPTPSYPEYLTEFNDALYFRAAGELWKYDGTNATIATEINATGDSYPKNLTVFGSYLLFAADDGVHGWELWKFNGTQSNLVVDLNPLGDSFPENFVILSNVLYFTATAPDTGYELYEYDGTNVTVAADINPGAGDSFPQFLTVFNGKLLFRAAGDGVNDWELWSYTPTSSPTPPPDITPQIQTIEHIGADIRIRWTTAGGSANIVQSTSDITAPFQDLSPEVIAPGSGEVTMEFTDTAAAAQPGARFYRVKRL